MFFKSPSISKINEGMGRMKKSLKILMGENLVWNCQVKIGSHHYANLFLKNQNRIFWLALPWNIFHFLIKGRKEERIKHWRWSRPIKVKENFYCLSPFTFSPYRNNFIIRHKVFANLALKFSIPNIHEVLKAYGFDKVDILWITDPRIFYLTTKVSYKTLIYRCVDDFTLFKDIPSSVAALENVLVKKSDIVFATSSALLDKLSKIRKDIVYLPNGVDYNFFANSYNADLLLRGFQKRDKSIAIYVGTVGEWFDAALLSQVAKSLPEVEFAIVGPVRRNVNQLKAQPNVTFYGHVPYESVPTIMKSSNVGIIPFQINKLTEAVCPIKLFEYFACGLPVVAPRTRELRKIASPAQLFSSADEFTSEIKRAVSLREKKSEYMEFARKNSWASRFEIVRKACQSLRFGKQL